MNLLDSSRFFDPNPIRYGRSSHRLRSLSFENRHFDRSTKLPRDRSVYVSGASRSRFCIEKRGVRGHGSQETRKCQCQKKDSRPEGPSPSGKAVSSLLYFRPNRMGSGVEIGRLHLRNERITCFAARFY
ncbi:hypothetical protein Trydic_g15270 [Trypoxylus dichotomus]